MMIINQETLVTTGFSSDYTKCIPSRKAGLRAAKMSNKICYFDINGYNASFFTYRGLREERRSENIR